MARTNNVWKTGVGGTFIQTIAPSGYDILINGTSKYLNFNTTVGTTGYGIRDNGGTMQFKNSGGAWANFGSGAGTVTSVATDASLQGGPITGTGTLGINYANPAIWTALHTFEAPGASQAAIFVAEAGAAVNIVEFQDAAFNILSYISPLGWMVDKPGRIVNGSAYTNATTTMSPMTGYTIPNVVEGRSYTGYMIIYGFNTITTDGLKFDMNGGTANFSSIRFGFAGAVAGAATIGTDTSSAAGTPITATKISGTEIAIMIVFEFFVASGGGGTVIPQFAETTAVAGTATIAKAGQLIVIDMG